mmetsp:Transcript_18786/g.47007  ORF Transcript_18786/g.47007 Transcript_18786/m.47007 type:complete len:204 (+) Transcript_18786:3-614(+)
MLAADPVVRGANEGEARERVLKPREAHDFGARARRLVLHVLQPTLEQADRLADMDLLGERDAPVARADVPRHDHSPRATLLEGPHAVVFAGVVQRSRRPPEGHRLPAVDDPVLRVLHVWVSLEVILQKVLGQAGEPLSKHLLRWLVVDLADCISIEPHGDLSLAVRHRREAMAERPNHLHRRPAHHPAAPRGVAFDRAFVRRV